MKNNLESSLQKLKVMFPEVKFERGHYNRLQKVIEEVNEAALEYRSGNRKEYLTEIVDVVASSMTLLYKSGYSEKEINNAIEYVRIKNDKRGYFDKDEWNNN